jgi:nucleotide-binding universal stress UspA family protein
MYAHILVPLDGSPLAEAALTHAEGLARKLGSRLLLVRVDSLPATLIGEVAPMGGPMPPELIEDAIEAETEESKEYLGKTAQRLKDDGLPVEWEVVEGDPAHSIIETAHQRGADLIAMATHGHSGLRRLVLGSVADSVVRGSHLPVLLVRPPVPDPQP